MRKDDEYESDRRVTENVLELEELKQSERPEVNKNEVMTNRNETIENDTDICIKEKEKEVDIENRVTRDKLDTDEMKQYDPETEEKQEIKEQIRDKDENESHDSVPEMKYREIIKEHKSDNVHKPKKHKKYFILPDWVELNNSKSTCCPALKDCISLNPLVSLYHTTNSLIIYKTISYDSFIQQSIIVSTVNQQKSS